MSQFIEAKTADLSDNFFTRIGTDWMLIGAELEGKVNMMTASWGGIGIYWGKSVAYSFVRPQRHTKAFVDGAEGFSLTFFPEGYREQLNFCGSKSGRDVDKVKECGFDVLRDGGIPYFEQANLVLLCRPMIAQVLDPISFRDTELDAAVYPQKDYHTLYISEITKVLVKK